MRRARCKHCGREIFWVKVGDENWRAFERIREIYTMNVILAGWTPVLRAPDEDVYQPHTIVCPRSKNEAPPAPPRMFDESRYP
jgi:hypothetical protein